MIDRGKQERWGEIDYDMMGRISKCGLLYMVKIHVRDTLKPGLGGEIVQYI